MASFYPVHATDDRFKQATALGSAATVACQRCGQMHWFWHDEPTSESAGREIAFFRGFTQREGCGVCDQEGFRLEKNHFTLILAVEGGWPGGERTDDPLVPKRDELQQGLQRRLGDVIRVDPWSGENPFPDARRYFLIRAAPRVSNEALLEATKDVVEQLGSGMFQGLTVHVTLVAEAGNTLGTRVARPYPR